MFNYASSPALQHSTFISNTANEGAGIYNLYSNPALGFLTIDPRYTVGSLLNPHKRNPEAVELSRGKAGSREQSMSSRCSGTSNASRQARNSTATFITSPVLTAPAGFCAALAGDAAAASSRLGSIVRNAALISTNASGALCRPSIQIIPGSV